MPAIKPPFSLLGQLDRNNWRLGGHEVVSFWAFNLAAAVASTSAQLALDAITQNGAAPAAAANISIAPDAAQRNGRMALVVTSSNRMTVGATPYPRAHYQRALPIAILARARFTSAAAANGVYSTAGAPGGSWSGAFLYQSAAGKLVCGYGDNTGSGTTAQRIKTGTTTLTAGSYTDLACVIRGATDMSLYVNGVDDAGTYSGTGGALANGGASTVIAAAQPANLVGAIDYIMQLAPFSGGTDIDATVIQALQFDPWALFAGSNANPWASRTRKHQKIAPHIADNATLAKTLADVTLSATATLKLQAALAKTLDDVTLSSASTLKLQAVLGQTLASVTLSSASTISGPVATLAATLDDVTLSSTATLLLKAAITAILEDVTLSAASTLPLRATLAAVLDDVTMVSTSTDPANSGYSDIPRKRRRVWH